MLMSRIGLKVKTLCLSMIVFIVLIQVFVSIISYDIPGVEGNKYDFNLPEMGMESMDPFGSMLDVDENINPNEIGMEGGKRFKLYEKKKLTHEKAEKFCKKREGSLAQAKSLDEMTRLQTLLMKARMVGGDIWVGADKKEWKKHSAKMLGGMERPNLGPNAMMLGGGPTQMCPALSSGTRSMTPSPCYKELPFVCEYGPGKGKLKKSKKSNKDKESNKIIGSKSLPNKKMRYKKRDEMKRRKREIVKLPAEADGGKNNSKTVSTSLERKSSMSPTVITTTMTLNEIGILDSETETPMNVDISSPSSNIVSTNSENSTAAHHIGFIPHVVHAKTDKNDTKGISQDMNSSNNTVMFLVRLSTKLMLEQQPHDVEDQMLDLDSNSIAYGSSTSEPTLLMNTMQLVSEADPDQAMVDLINEQSELQSLESMVIDVEANHSMPVPTPSSNSVETKSFTYDDYATRISTIEASSSSMLNETTEGRESEEKVEFEKNPKAKGIITPYRRYFGYREKSYFGETSSDALSDLDSETETINNFTYSSSTTDPVQTEELEGEENSTIVRNKFLDEPLIKNVSKSLLEPTIAIDLTIKEPRHHTGNDSSGSVPESLLSPLGNSSHRNAKSNDSNVKTTSRPSQTTTTTMNSFAKTMRTTQESMTVQRTERVANTETFNTKSTVSSTMRTTLATEGISARENPSETTSPRSSLINSSTPSPNIRNSSPLAGSVLANLESMGSSTEKSSSTSTTTMPVSLQTTENIRSTETTWSKSQGNSTEAMSEQGKSF